VTRRGADQASALPYRRHDGALEFCLVTSTTTGSWGFPKGNIDPGDTPETTALKEAGEEAGLFGCLEGGPLGSYEYVKRGLLREVAVYLMRVDSVAATWEEESFRERRWCSEVEARKILGHDSLRIALDAALERIAAVGVR
jgi:phosphohistidine phosphatase